VLYIGLTKHVINTKVIQSPRLYFEMVVLTKLPYENTRDGRLDR